MWELDHKKGWVLKKWCFWTMVLEKTLESLLDCKNIKPVNPKGNQPWIFIWSTDAETVILWLPDVKNWLIGKDPDAGKDWRQEEEGTARDEMAGRLSKLWKLVRDREAWCVAIHGVTKSWPRLSNWTELNWTELIETQETRVQPLGRKILCSRKWQPTPLILPG